MGPDVAAHMMMGNVVGIADVVTNSKDNVSVGFVASDSTHRTCDRFSSGFCPTTGNQVVHQTKTTAAVGVLLGDNIQVVFDTTESHSRVSAQATTERRFVCSYKTTSSQ